MHALDFFFLGRFATPGFDRDIKGPKHTHIQITGLTNIFRIISWFSFGFVLGSFVHKSWEVADL
jgi:hypothetical protein